MITRPPGLRRSRASSEELARRQVERDVRLAVGVDEDRVVALLGPPQERACVLGEDPQARRPHVEPPAADVGHLAVDLDAVDERVGPVVADGPRHGPAGVAEDRDRARRRAPAGGGGQHDHVVPVAAGEVGAGADERVDRLALVELEATLAAGRLDDPRVLVLGVGVVDHAARVALAFTIPTGSGAAPGDGGGHDRPTRLAIPSSPTSASASAKARNVRRVPTSGMSRSALRKVPARDPSGRDARRGAPSSARRRRSRRSASRIANGETMPSTAPASRRGRAPRAASRRTRRRRPCPARRRRDRGTARATNGTIASSTAATSTRRWRPRGRRRGGPRASADVVADRQRHEDDADRVGPDDRGVAEVRRQQARRRDLRAEAGGRRRRRRRRRAAG